MGQLLMTIQSPTEMPAIRLPEGFRTHQFHRDGDALFTLEDFRSQWIGIRDADHGKVMSDWFETVYNDSRVPDDGFFLIVRGENEIVSSASIQLGEHTPDSATVHAVCTTETYRGLGLGRAVMLQVLSYAAAHGICDVYLTTDDWRIPAVALYLKMGFLPVFYEADMRDRWIKICEEHNFTDIPMLNENGCAEILNAAK